MTSVQAKMTYDDFQKQMDEYNDANKVVDIQIMACSRRIMSFLHTYDGPLQVTAEPMVSTTQALTRAQQPAISGIQDAVRGLNLFCCRTVFLKLCAQDEHASIMSLLALDPVGPRGRRRPLDQAVSLRWRDLQAQKNSVQCRIARHEFEASQLRAQVHLLGWRARLRFGGTQVGLFPGLIKLI